MRHERDIPSKEEVLKKTPREEWEEWVAVVAEIGSWDEQVEALKAKGYLNGEIPHSWKNDYDSMNI